MNHEIERHLSMQSGVISRQQVLDAGLKVHDLRRMARRREWAMVHPGVYVSHTGPLTWVQRAWAGVLHSWPAALCDESALRAADGPGMRDRITDEVIHVGVERRRTSLIAPEGIAVHHLSGLTDRVQWNLGPPRARLLTTLAERERIARRRWLENTLRDVADGTCSVLEHAYLVHIERAHRLPRARRQARATASVGIVYRDATYDEGCFV